MGKGIHTNCRMACFDPINNLLIDHHYINIAHGTDNNDCSPIIGILDYAGAQKSMHLVSITNQKL